MGSKETQNYVERLEIEIKCKCNDARIVYQKCLKFNSF